MRSLSERSLLDAPTGRTTMGAAHRLQDECASLDSVELVRFSKMILIYPLKRLLHDRGDAV